MSNLSEYAHILRRFWWLAALPLAAMLAATWLTARPADAAPTYQVAMRFAAGLPPETDTSDYKYDRYYAWLASEYVANGFGDVVRTGAFADAVARRANAAGVAATAGQIQGGLSADHKQSITVVYVNWPDAEGAVKISEAVSQELAQNAAAYFPQLSGATVPALTRLDAPAASPVAAPLRSRFDVVVRVLIALAVGVALALAAGLLDPFVRGQRELDKLGLTLLAAIPREPKSP